jgi:hypothetical protein
LAVKRLVNADGMAIPPGPNGETFVAATHTHYLGTATFAAADLTTLIETVIEHQNRGSALVYINRAQETTVRGFAGFTPYTDARIVPATSAASARAPLDPNALYNRAVGIFGGAEIWTKPWMPANYAFAFLAGVEKPLVKRVPNTGPVGFTVEADDEVHPLRARVLAEEFGYSVWNRTNGAVLQTNNATYTDPTIT